MLDLKFRILSGSLDLDLCKGFRAMITDPRYQPRWRIAGLESYLGMTRLFVLGREQHDVLKDLQNPDPSHLSSSFHPLAFACR